MKISSKGSTCETWHFFRLPDEIYQKIKRLFDQRFLLAIYHKIMWLAKHRHLLEYQESVFFDLSGAPQHLGKNYLIADLGRPLNEKTSVRTLIQQLFYLLGGKTLDCLRGGRFSCRYEGNQTLLPFSGLVHVC